jgi:hypothetical protein
MKTVLRTTEVVKFQQDKVNAWVDGVVMPVYFQGPTLHNSPAKLILKDKSAGTVKFVEGRVRQDNDLKVYFVRNK